MLCGSSRWLAIQVASEMMQTRQTQQSNIDLDSNDCQWDDSDNFFGSAGHDDAEDSGEYGK